MIQIETTIHYLPYPPDQEFFNHKVNEEQEINENTLSSPISGQFFGLMLPESNKSYPISVSLFDENHVNYTEEINNNEISTNSSLEACYEPSLNSYSSIRRSTEKKSMSDQITLSETSLSSQNGTIEIGSSAPSRPITCSRTRWTKEEEETLIKLVERAGARRWNQIASVLKTKTAKQCRDHYANCLDPEIKNSLWTVEEERVLLMKYQEYGTHWSGIKKFLPGRTTSMIKNYVTMLLKKNERGLSHEFQEITQGQTSNEQAEESSSCGNSNAGSDTDDHNFSLNMDDNQTKYNKFSCLDIDCLLNRPKGGVPFA